MLTNSNSLLRRFFVTIASVAALSIPAFAQSTWNPGSTNWNLAGNWSPSGIPSNATVAEFSGTFTNQPTLTAATNPGSLWVTGSGNTGVSGLTDISGGSSFGLTIAGNVTTNTIANTGILLDGSGNNNLTIDNTVTGVTLSNSTGFYVNNTGTLTVAAPLALAGKTLTLGSTLAAGTGSIILNGNITSTGTGAITVKDTLGTTAVTLGGTNTYTGATTVTNGALTLTNFSAISTSALTMTGVSQVSGGNAVLNLLNNSTGTFTDSALISLSPVSNSTGSGGVVINVNELNGSGTAGSTLSLGTGANGILWGNGGFNTDYTNVQAVTITNGNAYNLALGAISVNGKTPVLYNDMTIGTVSIASWFATNPGARTFHIGGTSASATTSIGNMSGTTDNEIVSFTGAGTLLLTGTNSYTGSTLDVGTGTGGTIDVTTENGLYTDGTVAAWSATTINVSSGATFALQVTTAAVTGAGGAFSAGDVTTLAPIIWTHSGAILGLDTTQGNFAYGSNLLQVGSNVNGLTKLGANTLTLSGANTYTGTTTIANGTLSAGTIVVAAGSSNLGNASSAVVLGGVSSVGTGLTSGDLSYTGTAATYTRGFTVTAGGGEVDNTTTGAGNLLTIATGGITGSGPFTVGGVGNTTISAPITTTSSLTDNSTGTVILSGGSANTYTGGTTVNSGTLTDSGSAASSFGSGAFAVNGGTTVVNLTTTAATTTGPLSGTGASTINTQSTRTFTVNQTAAGIYAGSIAGPGNFALGASSNNTLTLTGTNTYTGTTAVPAGTLAITAGTPLGATAITVSGTGALLVGTASSTASTTIGVTSTGGSLALNSAGTLNLENGAINALDINSSASATALTFGGGGVIDLDLSGGTADSIVLNTGLAASASGSTTINVNLIGNLTPGNTITLISAPGGGLTNAGTNFTLGSTTLNGYSLNGDTLTLTETPTAVTLTEAATSSAFWYGPGTSWNTIGNFSTIGTGYSARSAALDSQTAVTFNATGGTNSSSTTLDGNRTIGTLTYNVGGVGIGSGTPNPSTLTISAAGPSLTVGSSLGAETISANVAMGGNQTWTVNSGSSLAVSGAIGDGGHGYSLTLNGTGTLALSGTNTYTGPTTVSTGILNLQSAGALGTTPGTSGTSSVTVSATGAALQLQGTGTLTAATPLTLNGTGVSSNGALENVGSGTNTYSGPITLGSNASIGADASSSLNLTGATISSISTYGLTLTGGGSGYLYNIIGAGINALTMSGSGTWDIEANNNSYSGTTTVSSGTLVLGLNQLTPPTGTTGFLGSTSNTLTVNGGTLDLDGWNLTVGNLMGSAGTITNNYATPGNVYTSGSFLTINGSANGSYAGSITNGSNGNGTTGVGILSLVKQGSGIQTLTGSNTYTGPTTISGGALKIAGSGALSSATSVTVSSGAALQLSGGFTNGAASLSLVGTGVSSNGALENVSGSNTYNGPITLAGNTSIGSDTTATLLTLNSSTAITGSGDNLALMGAGNGLISSAIGTGSGTVTMSGTGTWTLSGNNTYTGTTNVTNTGTLVLGGANTGTGATNINSGTLVYNSLGALSNSSAINVGSGATAVNLTYGGSGGTLSTALNFSGTTGAVTLGNSGSGAIIYSGTPTFGGIGARTIVLGNTTDTVGGSIGGITNQGANVTSLTKAGLSNSTWVLTGGDTYTGTTQITGGVLSVSAASDLPGFLSDGYINLNGGGGTTYAVLQTNGTISRTLSGTANASDLNWGANSGFAAIGGSLTVTVNGGTSLNWGAGNFMGAGTSTLVFGSTTSNNQVTLTNGIDFGTTTGTLSAGFNRGIDVEGAAATIVGGTANYGVSGSSALLSGIITANTPVTLNVMNVPTTGDEGDNGFVKTGNGTLILTGANTYSGVTIVNGGTLIAGTNALVGQAGAFGDGHTTTYPAGSIPAGPVAGNQLITLGGGNFNSGDGADGTTATGASPTVLIGGAYTVAIPITVSLTPTTGTYGIGGSTNNAATFSGAITLNEGLTVTQVATTGSNALSLTGGSITGPVATGNPINLTFANAGAVNVGDAIANGAGTSLISVVQSGAGFTTFSATNTYTGKTTISAGTLEFANEASLYNDGAAATWNASNIIVQSGGTLALGVGVSPQFTTGDVTTLLTALDGSVTTGGLLAGSAIGFDTTNASGGTFTVSNAIANTTGTGGGAVGLTKLGAGTLILTNTNTYTGPTTISGGTLQLGTGTSGSDGTITSSSSIVDNGNLTYDRFGSYSYGGVISGSGSVTELGAGTQTLSGSNTYAGGTTVTAGTLYVDNTSGSGTGTGGVTVGTGATLAGNGFIKPGSGATSGVSITSGGSLYSGGTPTGPATSTGLQNEGITLDNTAAHLGNLGTGPSTDSILSVSGDAPANLTFALGAGNNAITVPGGVVGTTSGNTPYDFGNPDTNSTYMTVLGSTAGEINFSGDNTTVTLVDTTNTGALQVGTLALAAPQLQPYLLIAAGADSDYYGLVTEAANGVLSLDQNGWVVGVYTGINGATPTSAQLLADGSSAYTQIAILQDNNAMATVTGYVDPQLYLYDGDLEVVPEPGTWTLMLGGLALLVFIQQRRKSKLS